MSSWWWILMRKFLFDVRNSFSVTLTLPTIQKYLLGLRWFYSPKISFESPGSMVSRWFVEILVNKKFSVSKLKKLNCPTNKRWWPLLTNAISSPSQAQSYTPNNFSLGFWSYAPEKLIRYALSSTQFRFTSPQSLNESLSLLWVLLPPRLSSSLIIDKCEVINKR